MVFLYYFFLKAPFKEFCWCFLLILTQAKIISDDSLIHHHYQLQNVFDAVWPRAYGSAASVKGWYGLHFSNRPWPRLIFYACQSNHAMTACVASLPSKTQISPLMIKVTHTLLYRSHPHISLRERGGGGDWPLGLQLALTSSLLGLFGAAQVLSASLLLLVTRRGQHRNQSFPLRQCDLLLTFICVSLRGLSFFMSLSLDHRDLLGSPVICCQYPKSSDC